MTHGIEKNLYLLDDEERFALTNAVKFRLDGLNSAHARRGLYTTEQMMNEAINAANDLYELNHDGGGWTKISVNMEASASDYRDALELDAESGLVSEDLSAIVRILDALNQ